MLLYAIVSLHQWHKMVLKHIICYNYFWDKISSNKSSSHERPTGIAYFLFCPQSHLQHYLLNFFLPHLKKNASFVTKCGLSSSSDEKATRRVPVCSAERPFLLRSMAMTSQRLNR